VAELEQWTNTGGSWILDFCRGLRLVKEIGSDGCSCRHPPEPCVVDPAMGDAENLAACEMILDGLNHEVGDVRVQPANSNSH